MIDRVYRLQRATGQNYDAFVFADETSLLGESYISNDFSKFNSETRVWEARKLGSLWKPREVVGHAGIGNDFTTTSGIPTFSSRAVSDLGDLLESNGELLPVLTHEGIGHFYLFNVTTVVNALDQERSKIGVLGFGPHEFIRDRLGGLSIFRIPQSSRFTYVTERFSRQIYEHNLHGFNLIQVWPQLSVIDTLRAAGFEWIKSSNRLEPKAAEPIVSREISSGAELDALKKSTTGYQEILGFDVSQMTVEQAQQRIEEDTMKLKESELGENDKNDRSFWLAIAWGESLKKSLAWEWVMLVKGESKTVGIASADRSYVVPVVQFFERLVKGDNDATSRLCYNLIISGQYGPAEPGECKLIA